MNKPKLSLANPFFAFFLLTALFALTAVATIAANRFLGRKYESQPTDTELSQARADAIAAIPQLPKDTEEKLSAALHPELTPITAAFVDPLIDRLGIDRGTQANTPRLTSPPLATPLLPTTPEKVVRLIQWQQAARNAYALGLPAPSITTAYLISELSPAGRITTSGAHAAWLYIESEKRQIAANVGAKFYDGILAGIDRQGVVFRTSTGQTKLIQWDRQEEFSARPTTPPSTERPPQPVQAKPASETTPADNFTPGALARPNAVGRRDDYSDLEIAARARYVQNTNPNATNAIIDNESPSDQVITPNRTTSAPILTTIPNPFSANTGRPNQLDYAHAPQTQARATLNFRTATAAAVFNLDDTTSFSEKSNSQSSILPVAQTNEVPAPTPTPSPAQTPELGKEAAGPITGPINAKAQPEPRNTLCDSTYHGENLSITNESNRPLSLLTLVNRLNEAYSANIVLDYDVQETPVRLTITNAPWTSILRTLLDLNDLDMVCLDGGIVQIAKRTKIASMGDLRRRSAPIVREVFKLKYLQQTAGARANLAGQTQTTNGATIQSLEDAIRDILKAGGDPRGEARRVPGRNQLLVAATAEQMQDIRDLIARVDRPGYQVKISALVYTANENRLRDIGSQIAIVVGNSSGTNLGGGTTLPNSNTGSGNGGDNQQPSGLNPGGIPGLASGMRVPSNGLSAANPLATFGVTSVFGTAQFAYQLTLAQQKGVVNIQSRPFGIVADGDTFDLVAGTQIPVVTTTIAGGAPFQSGQVQFIEASRIARITPQVAEDETGKPNYVTLNIQLENNSVDTSLGTFNGVPGVNRQSLQTVLRLGNGETVVIGGLAADQVANSVSKVPGLGSIPLLGNLFKRHANQENRDRLYFAITVEVIPQNSLMPNFVAPADAITTPPPPPRAQKPSPYDKRQ
jgi:Flp pilus assembly secretin CpaC